ncbi:hypothetical protein [Curvivirga aplysinae]|uniref:hypothetical protein n=1 Tax=Curvivirga aplysinae TaxID=2529852 RepID=UPI0012BBD59A|nr:hypothetical protein [Curvivirga aplysinae]MTI11439.1 hypothetical protein [Curvivirga aplysinae]
MPSDFYRLYLSDTDRKHPICDDPEDLLEAVDCKANSLNGLVILDCFWQLEEPIKFLAQLEKALAPDASAIFIEPLLSPMSYAIAKLKHPNNLNIKAKPYKNSGKINFATSSLIFDRIENRIQFMKEFPNLTFDCRERINLFTGWVDNDSPLLDNLFKLDQLLMPFLGNFAASHMKVILRKKA